jgi:hypothetical protein
MSDEVYAIGPADGRVACVLCFADACLSNENDYGPGEAVLGNPAISPYGDAQAHYYCLGHLGYISSDFVIYEPSTPMPGFKRPISLAVYKARAVAGGAA